MTPAELSMLLVLLIALEKEDLGEFDAFAKGEWSRHNLEAMISDIIKETRARG